MKKREYLNPELANAFKVLIIILLIGIMIIALNFFFGYSKGATEALESEPEVVGRWTVNKWGYEGHWIHVKVDNRSYDAVVETCIHEATHEMVARRCSANYDKCEEVLG